MIDQKKVTILVANHKNDIYILDMFFTDNSLRHCFFFRSQSHLNWLIWHKILSYLNFKKVSKISGNQLVGGMPKMKFIKDNLCSMCEKAKQTKSSFKPKSSSSITKQFHILHMDLFGSVPIKS